jgi:integrase
MRNAAVLEMPAPAAPAKPKRAERKRSHGEGRVYLRGATWWIQYYVNGEQVRESSKSEQKGVATDLLQRRLVAARNGELAPVKVPYTAMRDLLYAKYAQERRKCLLTRADGTQYIGPVPALDRFFEEYNAQEITPIVCRQFIAARQEAGVSNDGINGSLRVLGRMFHLLVEEHGYPVTKVPAMPLLPANKGRKDFLTAEQYKAVHAALPEELQPLFETSYHTGVRKSNLLDMRWAQVNFDAGMLVFPETKNGEELTVPFVGTMAATFKALHAARKPQPEDLVFTRGGKPILDFRGGWSKALAAAGVQGKHLWHGNRRSAAVNLMAAGVDEQTAMSITGHKDVATFRKYRQLLDAAKLAAAVKLTQHLAGAAPQNGAKNGAKRNAKEKAKQ